MLARGPDRGEVVLTGRGIGFQARAGGRVDQTRIARTFVPSSASDAHRFAELVAHIPPEHLTIAAEALDLARGELGLDMGSAVVVAVADHLNFAITRRELGIQIDYPLEAEIIHLYPREFEVARQILRYVNERIDSPLPPEESVPLTLHLVNAAFARADLSATFQMTEVLGQVFEVIETQFGTRVDRCGISAARFITHLRYLFIRMKEREQYDDLDDGLSAMLHERHPEAYQCAVRIQHLLELRLGQPLTANEVSY